MPAQTPISRRHAILACVALLVTVLICAALLTLAVLLHAPPAALPVLLVACIGGPALAAHELPHALEALRARQAPVVEDEDDLLERLRRFLDELPETAHPLDL
jgi:hypothetical protein